MFSILSETLMTASRMDGFRYPSGKATYRAELWEPDAARRTPRPDARETAVDQPL